MLVAIHQSKSLPDLTWACRSARQAAPAPEVDRAPEATPPAELAFEGLHVLEMPYLPEDVSTAQLEAFAATFGQPPQGPVVRCDSHVHGFRV